MVHKRIRMHKRRYKKQYWLSDNNGGAFREKKNNYYEFLSLAVTLRHSKSFAVIIIILLLSFVLKLVVVLSTHQWTCQFVKQFAAEMTCTSHATELDVLEPLLKRFVSICNCLLAVRTHKQLLIGLRYPPGHAPSPPTIQQTQ